MLKPVIRTGAPIATGLVVDAVRAVRTVCVSTWRGTVMCSPAG